MAAVISTREMCCRSCRHVWDTSASLPEDAVDCPNCGLHVCACGCGIDLSDMKANAVWFDRSHYMRLYRAEQAGRIAANPHATRTRHALDEVRGDAEENPEKARWTLIVREQIARTLIHTGYFSAADLEPLGIPAAHGNVCTSQIGTFASRRLMEKVRWRKSEKPSRKGGILWTFRITEKGRKELPKIIAGTGATGEKQREGTAGASTAPSTDPSFQDAPTPAGADPGEAPADGTPGSDGGASPDQLFAAPEDRPSTSPYDAEAA